MRLLYRANSPGISIYAHRKHTCRRRHQQAVPRAQKTAVFIGQVWPERSSSAAGVRTADLITAFQRWGWNTAFLSSAAANEHTKLLDQQGCRTFHVPPNKESLLRDALDQAQPTVCIFDRFYTEEAFSFRLRDLFPDCLRILDMQDMHALRLARQAIIEQGGSLVEALTTPPLAAEPALQRELAAIHRLASLGKPVPLHLMARMSLGTACRSDLALACSPVEQALLKTVYQIPPHKLCPAPFFASQPDSKPQPFSQRSHFMTIGNWRHPPNRDGVQWLCQHIWPSIRRQLPDAELHIYGAYMSKGAQQFHKPAAGVFIKGFAPSLDIMRQYKVCLAPLRFGAGLKGKIVDSWLHGLPVCTTPVGAEGMFAASTGPEGFPDTTVYQSPDKALHLWFEAASHGDNEAYGQAKMWGGLWTATSAEAFAANAVSMYTSEDTWCDWQRVGSSLVDQLYGDTRLQIVEDAVQSALQQWQERRQQDYVGSMLWSQQLRATEYFSRWLELKESNKQ